MNELYQILSAGVIGAGAILIAGFRFVDVRTEKVVSDFKAQIEAMEHRHSEEVGRLEARVKALEDVQGSVKSDIVAALGAIAAADYSGATAHLQAVLVKL